MDKTIGNIFQTTEYEKFKVLGGNRVIDHSDKVAESIKLHGQLNSPIIVNEKFEIIDGQNRFEAFMRLNLPVPYIVNKGYGIKECVAMNSVSKNWSTEDHIKSYADRGNKDYSFLYDTLIQYKHKLPARVIFSVISGNMEMGNTTAIRSGTFKLGFNGNETYIREILDYLCKFNISNIKGNAGMLYKVFYFCYTEPEIDNDKLLLFFEKYSYIISAIVDTKSAVESIERIYNFKCNKTNYKFITSIYQKKSIERNAANNPGGGNSNFYKDKAVKKNDSIRDRI